MGGGAGRRRLALLAGLLALGLPAAAARAGGAVIAEPLLDGALSDKDRARIVAVPEEALRELHFEVVPAQDVKSALAGEPQLQGCHSELCFERLGRLLDGELVLRQRVRLSQPAGQPSGSWHMNIELLDVEVGAIGARLTEDCNGCTVARAASQLLDMVRRTVVASAARPRGLLVVHSQPAGAAVFVDGTELGITPYSRLAFVGPHKLVLRHVGYRTEQRELQVEADDQPRRRIDISLTEGSDSAPPTAAGSDQPPVYKKWWFWLAVGGGVVAASAITAGAIAGSRSGQGDPGRTLPANTFAFSF